MRLNIFTVLIVLGILSSLGAEAHATEVQLYAEKFDSSTQQSFPIATYSEPAQKQFYSNILAQLEIVFSKQDQHIIYSADKTKADYQIVFIDIPLFYNGKPRRPNNQVTPIINPPLPFNKHAAEIAQDFNSPWLNAKLYTKKNQVVGGIIFIPIAPFSKLKDLYYASQNEWDKIANRPYKLENFSIEFSQIQRIANQYQEIFLQKKYKPTKEHLNEVFGAHENTSLIGKLSAISWQSTRGPFIANVISKGEECIKQADLLYYELYASQFSHLLSRDNFNSDKALEVNLLKNIFSTNQNCFL